MSLAFFQLTPWVSGFIGTVFTRDFYVASTVFSFIWLTPVWIAQNRNAPDNTQMGAHLYAIISLILGCAVGAALNWACNYPRLFDMRFFRDPEDVYVRKFLNYPIGFHPRTWAPETTFLLFDALMIVIGYYYVQGNYEPGASDSGSKAGGWILIGVGAAFFIATILWMWLSKGLDWFNKRQDSKYAWPLAACIAIQASYDLLAPEKWNGVILLLLIAAVWAGNYFYFGYAGFRSDEKNWTYFGSGYLGSSLRGKNDPYVDRFYGHAQAFGFVLVVGLTHFLTAIAFYIADGAKAGSILTVMVVLSAVSGFWLLVFLAWGLYYRHQKKPTDGYVDCVHIFLHPVDTDRSAKGSSWVTGILNGKYDRKLEGRAAPPLHDKQPPPADMLPKVPAQDQGDLVYSSRITKKQQPESEDILMSTFI